MQPSAMLKQLKGLDVRAVRISPAVMLACVPQDRFDLVIATNVFVYYDNLEQTLALANISAMLKPGGFLLSNNNLLELPEVSMQSGGYTSVRYAEGATAGDHIIWYRKR